jgi:hypothetical protein
MLRIIVELFPGGSPTGRRTLALMDIANVSMLDVSDYVVATKDAASPWRAACERKAKVTGHRRDQPVWSLVAKAAAAVSEGE